MVRGCLGSQQARTDGVVTVAISFLNEVFGELVSLRRLPRQAQPDVGIGVDVISRAAGIGRVIKIVGESSGFVGVIKEVGSSLIGRTDPMPGISEKPQLIFLDRDRKSTRLNSSH